MGSEIRSMFIGIGYRKYIRYKRGNGIRRKQDGYNVDKNGLWKSYVTCGKSGRWESHNGMGFSFAYGVEVIGNIHDNPELMEV